jgi:NAD-dependent aldehyde dehydrogenases
MEQVVNAAKDHGMKILAGGSAPDLSGKFSKGFFYSPTLIGDADQQSSLFQDEIFGPVIGVKTVNDWDETIRLSNNSRFGLASYLFTEDNKRIFQAAEAVRFGELYVNMPGPESSQGYHTGFRLTGQAGEGSKYGIEDYLKLKNLYVDYSREKLKLNSVPEF